MSSTLLRFLLLSVLSICLSVHSVKAEVPQVINYQARLIGTDDEPVDGDITLTFRLYLTQTGGHPYGRK